MTKTPRFYIPKEVRERVNEIADATGLTPGAVVGGAIAHLLNEHRRTGHRVGPELATLIRHAEECDARDRARAMRRLYDDMLGDPPKAE